MFLNCCLLFWVVTEKKVTPPPPPARCYIEYRDEMWQNENKIVYSMLSNIILPFNKIYLCYLCHHFIHLVDHFLNIDQKLHQFNFVAHFQAFSGT